MAEKRMSCYYTGNITKYYKDGYIPKTMVIMKSTGVFHQYTEPPRKIVTEVRVNGTVYNACWDTGATECSISEKAARDLNLRSIGVGSFSTLNGTANKNLYKVKLELPDGTKFFDLEVFEADLYDPDYKVDFLIGMDVISKGDFIFKHLENGIEFSFEIV